MAKRPPFDLSILRERLAYDPTTGHLTWLVVPSNNVWVGQRAGVRLKTGYRKTYAHHVAWYLHHNVWPDQMVDHINGDRDDNRAANLRLATQAQQNANTKLPSTNSSGHKGVARCTKTNRWRAYITKDRKQIFLGNFIHFDDAVNARRAAESKVFGEYIRPHSIEASP